MIVRRQRADDYEAIRGIYAAAFARPETPDSVPPEVGLFEALWEAGDVVPDLSSVITAADAGDVQMIVVLGSPQYYSRFGFRPAGELGVIPPEPSWGDAFQARALTAYSPAVAGRFEYAPAFS